MRCLTRNTWKITQVVLCLQTAACYRWGVANDAETIGSNITRLREQKGWTQTQLGDAMQEAGQTHWRQTTVSRVERGGQDLRFAELAALVSVLGRDVLAGTFVRSLASYAPDASDRWWLVDQLLAARNHLDEADVLLRRIGQWATGNNQHGTAGGPTDGEH